MKKTIIALVCFTMSMVALAQPQPQCCVDSATLKTVMELRKKYHENFRKELRQTLGDEKYIQYLESQVYMKKHRAMHKRKNVRRMGKWSQRRRPMMHPGFRGQHPGAGVKAADGKDKKSFIKDKKNDKKKDSKKDDKK